MDIVLLNLTSAVDHREYIRPSAEASRTVHFLTENPVSRTIHLVEETYTLFLSDSLVKGNILMPAPLKTMTLRALRIKSSASSNVLCPLSFARLRSLE